MVELNNDKKSEDEQEHKHRSLVLYIAIQEIARQVI